LNPRLDRFLHFELTNRGNSSSLLVFDYLKMAQLTIKIPAAAELPPYVEILDFLANSPTPEPILGFKVSEQSQERLSTLLQKNRDTRACFKSLIVTA
jgi:hypothetical protein